MKHAKHFSDRHSGRIHDGARVRAPRRHRRGAGFSLLELLVALLVMSIAVVGALVFFDTSSRLAKTEVGLSEIQSTQRIVHQELSRMLAMAGVGGLPDGIDPLVADAEAIGTGGVFPTGLALAVDNNVAPGTDLGNASDPLPVVPGTDVLTLRGVFSTPVYYVEPQQPLLLDGAGKVTLKLTSDVDFGVGQDLDSLRQALIDGGPRPEAFVVYDRYFPAAFAVLEWVPGESALGVAGSSSMSLVLSLGATATYEEPYGRMVLGTALAQGAGGQTWAVPGATYQIQLPKNVGAIGLLEEYRFFVRQEREVPGAPASRLTPTLTRARYYPNTGVLHPEGALDVADNVVDFQLALAVDQAPVDGRILEVGEAADDDEVLYNATGDSDGLDAITTSLWANPASRLLFVRFSTLVQADRPDRDYAGSMIDQVEDHDYSGATPSIFNTGGYTKLRKRLLRTVVETRNLP